MKKIIFRYILCLQLIIRTFSTEAEVKYEITNKEATTSLPAKTEIITIAIGDHTNQTTNFTIPNGQDANSTKYNEIPILIKPVEQNGLDAIFAEQTNLTTGLKEIILLDNLTKNMSAVILQNEVPANESIKSINVEEKDFKYVNQDKSANVSTDKSVQLPSERGYKSFGYNNIKSNHLHLFGSYIEPFGINANEQINGSQEENSQNKTNIKYILQWTKNDRQPFTEIAGAGQQAFIDKNCSYTNCIVIKRNSSNRIDYKQFDAVVFFARDLQSNRKQRKSLRKLSKKRLPYQKYVFADLHYHRVRPKNRYSNFFNWTFTYKLNSDLTWAPFVVRDMNGSVVAPSRNVTWLKHEDMLPVPQNVMNVLLQKSVGVLWFYPCNMVPSRNYCFIRNLLRILKLRYGVHFDKISKCWYEVEATEEIKALMSKVIKRDYYFYIVFEEEEDADYVTNEILEAVNNYAIPVVLGGANCSRYLPDKSYLDASLHSPFSLAGEMYKLLRDFDLFNEYFKWTSHYTFHRPDESPETDHICRMCEMLNNETKLNETTVYENITEWWDKVEKDLNSNHESVVPLKTGYSEELFFQGQKKRKRPMTPKDFFRKSAFVYTTFVDSVIDGVKSVFTTMLG